MPSREKIAMPTLIDIGTLITRSPDVCGDRPREDEAEYDRLLN
jgi:hypothetical protein